MTVDVLRGAGRDWHSCGVEPQVVVRDWERWFAIPVPQELE